MATPIPPAEHARTISHMNKDHAEDLSLYLRHFNRVPPANASGANLESIDLTGMTIHTTTSGTYRVAFKPPLASWSDRRARLVDMSITARAALLAPDPDLGGVFRLPAPFPDVMTGFGVAFFFFTSYAVFSGRVAPGTAVWDLLERVHWPGGPEGFGALIKVMFLPVWSIHVAETATLHATRLRRYGVKTGSLVWWGWMVACFFEGVCTFWRFDGLVLERKREVVEREVKKE